MSEPHPTQDPRSDRRPYEPPAVEDVGEPESPVATATGTFTKADG
jgi:hypothetical protein